MNAPGPILVVGDLHLARHRDPAVARDLAALLDSHPGGHLVVAGDFFDLVTDAPELSHRQAVRAVLAVQPELRRGLGGFLDGGGQLTLLSGNHDAELDRDALLDALEPGRQARGRVRHSPWFWRQDTLHIEHGHFYDPDNAPAHPLVVGEPSLGVHFSTEFVHPTQAHRYLQVNDDTPLKLLLAAFRWYGARGPYVVYRYFHAAFSALGRSGPLYRAGGEKQLGAERQARFAEDMGVPSELVDEVLSLGAPSTLDSWSRTAARLYLDRVVATLLCTGGLTAAASGSRRGGSAALGLGAMLMTFSWLSGHDRYRGSVVERLEKAAERIATTTATDLVVLGHTHRATDKDGYSNTGSFAFPLGASGRPYLEIVERGGRPQALRRHWPG